MPSTSRLGLIQEQSTDLMSNYPAVEATNLGILDGSAIWNEGTLGTRPVASVLAAGTFYRSTDEGAIFVTDGSTWHTVGQLLSGTNAALPPASVSAGMFYKTTDASKLYVSDGNVWTTIASSSGSSIIDTDEFISSSSFVTMPTPDQVTNLVLPADGLIEIWFQAQWGCGTDSTAQAAIFINGNQLVFQANDAVSHATWPQACHYGPNQHSQLVPLSTCPFGLTTTGNSSSSHDPDVTTGQIFGCFIYPGGVAYGAEQNIGANNGQWSYCHNAASASGGYINGGACTVFAAAGTYTVSIRYKIGLGPLVFAQLRRLYVRVKPYS